MSEIVKTAPETGLSDEANNSAPVWLDCSDYVGRYVHLYSLVDDLLFAPNSVGSGSLALGDAATPTALVPDAVPAGAIGTTFLVEASQPFLGVQSVAEATARFYVVPTSRRANGVPV